MKPTRLFIIIPLSLLFLIGGVAACKRGYHAHSFDEFDLAAVTNRIASRLDLTESQKADLELMAAEIAEKVKDLHGDRAARHQEMADLVRQDTLDKATLDGLIDTKLQHMKEMADFVAERMIAFHATLTPEQRERVAAHIEDHSSGGCRFGFR